MPLRNTARSVAVLVGMLSMCGDQAAAAPVGQGNGEPALPGLMVETAYTGDVVHNLDPGIVAGDRKTVYLGLLDIGVQIDTGEAGWWQGGVLHVQAINMHGDQPSARYIGDLQVASNIEAESHTLLYEAWYEQHFAADRASLRIGLQDLNSELYLSEDAALFLNSSFGIGPEISANVPTSTFPRPGFGVRLRLQPVDRLTLFIASYDGDPTTRKLSKSEGRMDIAEIDLGYRLGNALPGTFRFGAWRHTAVHPAPFGGQRFPGDRGYYVHFDQQVADWQGGGLDTFLHYGAAPKERNAVDSCLAAGIRVAGPFANRPDDRFGIGMTRAGNLYAPGRRGFETTWELTYRLRLGKHISLQPSYQWIRHPQGNPANRNIRVLIGRLMIDL